MRFIRQAQRLVTGLVFFVLFSSLGCATFGSPNFLNDPELIPAGPRETLMLKDAQDRHLDDFDLAEAAIIASGAPPQLEKMLHERLEEKLAPVMHDCQDIQNHERRAKALLTSLYRHILRRYKSGASTLDLPLTTGDYNCLSSAVLYNIAARRLNLEVDAMMLPTHVYSLVRTLTGAIEVETTNPNGFNPNRKSKEYMEFLRVRELLPKLTGDDGKNQTIEIGGEKAQRIDNVTLLSLIYSNRGVDAMEADQPKLARAFYTRSMLMAEPGARQQVRDSAYVAINHVVVKALKKGRFAYAKKQLDWTMNNELKSVPVYLRTNYTYATNEIAIRKLKRRNYGGAESILQPAVNLFPKNKALRNNLGLAKEGLALLAAMEGDCPKTERYLKQSKKYLPNRRTHNLIKSMCQRAAQKGQNRPRAASPRPAPPPPSAETPQPQAPPRPHNAMDDLAEQQLLGE